MDNGGFSARSMTLCISEPKYSLMAELTTDISLLEPGNNGSECFSTFEEMWVSNQASVLKCAGGVDALLECVKT
jgi:hypothetical protein